MKLVSLLTAAVIGLFLCLPSLLLAESEGLVEIKSIDHTIQSKDQETITFTLAAKIPVRMFTLKGERPRLVIDFPDATYKGQNVIALESGELASSVRVGLHKEPKKKARVVIDLSKSFEVDYKHSFLESEKLLEVVLTRGEKREAVVGHKKEESPVTELSDKAVAKNESAATAAVTPAESPQEEITSPPVDDTPTPPALTTPQKQVEVAESDDVSPGLPQLLEVSFDDSSKEGEMVLFHLNDFFPPTVSAIEKNKPRVLCDFKNMRLSRDVQTKIEANGKYVKGIRTAYHADKNMVRVVLDLSPDRDYDLQQVFFKNDNLFVLIVNELSTDQKNN